MLLFFVSPENRLSIPCTEKNIVVIDTMKKAREYGFRSSVFLLQFCLVKFLYKKPFFVYAVRSNNKCIHYVMVFGKTWRFPFMGQDDLCVAYAWTSPHFRNQGFFSTSLKHILFNFQDRRVWIFADPSNAPSLNCFKKAGFEYAGKGRLTKPLGSRLLGRYRIEEIS